AVALSSVLGAGVHATYLPETRVHRVQPGNGHESIAVERAPPAVRARGSLKLFPSLLMAQLQWNMQLGEIGCIQRRPSLEVIYTEGAHGGRSDVRNLRDIRQR